MMIQSILLSVFVLVGLTFLSLFWSGRGGRPDDAGWENYRFHVLFYVLAALAIETRHADLILVLLAWVFVMLQVFLAGFFATGTSSRGLFIAGALVLLAMWVYFAIRVLFPV